MAAYANEFTGVIDSAFGTDYISDEQLLVIATLATQPRATVVALSELSGLERGQVLRFLRDLTARGLVAAQRSTVDRRKREYLLTDAGREAADRAANGLERFFATSASLAEEIVRLTAVGAAPGRSSGAAASLVPLAWELAAEVARTGQQLSEAIASRLGNARAERIGGRRIIALLVITSHDACRPSTLVSDLGISPAGATYMIDTLESQGLAQRVRGIDADRRAIHIVATAEGIAAATAVRDALEDITPALHRQFTRLLTATVAASA